MIYSIDQPPEAADAYRHAPAMPGLPLSRKATPLLMAERQRTPIAVIKDHTADMSRAFLKCRSTGHKWDEDDTASYIKIPNTKPEAAELTLVCGRCTSQRVDRMERRRGRWISAGRHYQYAEGYLIEPGSNIGLTRADYREEQVLRDLGRD